MYASLLSWHFWNLRHIINDVTHWGLHHRHAGIQRVRAECTTVAFLVVSRPSRVVATVRKRYDRSLPPSVCVHVCTLFPCRAVVLWVQSGRHTHKNELLLCPVCPPPLPSLRSVHAGLLYYTHSNKLPSRKSASQFNEAGEHIFTEMRNSQWEQYLLCAQILPVIWKGVERLHSQWAIRGGLWIHKNLKKKNC